MSACAVDAQLTKNSTATKLCVEIAIEAAARESALPLSSRWRKYATMNIFPISLAFERALIDWTQITVIVSLKSRAVTRLKFDLRDLKVGVTR